MRCARAGCRRETERPDSGQPYPSIECKPRVRGILEHTSGRTHWPPAGTRARGPKENSMEDTTKIDGQDRLVTTGAAAKALGVSVATVKRLTDAGKLSCIRTPGGHRKFLSREIAQFVAKASEPDADKVTRPEGES